MDPTAYWERNDHTVRGGTGEIRLDTGGNGPKVPPLGAPVAAKPISVAREVVERRAEVGGGHSSGDRPDNITVRSEGPLPAFRDCARNAWPFGQLNCGNACAPESMAHRNPR